MQLIQLTFPPRRATPHPTLPSAPPRRHWRALQEARAAPRKVAAGRVFPLEPLPPLSLYIRLPPPNSLPRPDNAPSPATGARSGLSLAGSRPPWAGSGRPWPPSPVVAEGRRRFGAPPGAAAALPGWRLAAPPLLLRGLLAVSQVCCRASGSPPLALAR